MAAQTETKSARAELVSASSAACAPARSEYALSLRAQAAGCRVVSFGRAIGAGAYPVAARFARYLDFQDGGDILGLTDLEGEGGAHTIVLAGLRAGWTERAAELVVAPDAIYFDEQVFPRSEESLYRDSVECAAFAALPDEEKRRRLGFFEEAVCKLAAPLSMAVVLDPARGEHFRGAFAEALCARFIEGASACAVGDYPKALALLQGVGYGLTPSGDDFLCGAMYALHFAAACLGACAARHDTARAESAACGQAKDELAALTGALRETLSRSAQMSRTFLRDAIAGRWSRRLRDAAESLGQAPAPIGADKGGGHAPAPIGADKGSERTDGGEYDFIRAAVLRALEHGASSGADMLSGFLHTMFRYFEVHTKGEFLP